MMIDEKDEKSEFSLMGGLGVIRPATKFWGIMGMNDTTFVQCLFIRGVVYPLVYAIRRIGSPISLGK